MVEKLFAFLFRRNWKSISFLLGCCMRWHGKKMSRNQLSSTRTHVDYRFSRAGAQSRGKKIISKSRTIFPHESMYVANRLFPSEV
jgi:hypothetical protein